MDIKCLQCKGRHFCGRSFCPIQVKIASQKKVNQGAKQDYFGEAPNVFVGHYGYPNLNVGFLNVEEYAQHDDPLLWSKEGYDINRIISLRSELINSNFKVEIRDVRGNNNKYLEMGKEIAMASEPVDVEVNLEKKPHFSLNFSQDTAPYGPRVKLKKAEITENPKIPAKVEKVVDDIDLKANDAVNLLYEKGFDEHYLTKLFSVGNLGVKTQRKIVPTRWSITAVDDSLCKNLLNGIRECPETGYLAYFGGHLGNYYLILFFPDVWSYELFETYVGNADYAWPFATDHEGHNGRKDYADNTAGGYYAARLAIAEKLSEIRRQGSCLCLRFITNEYWAPLGVWVVREATRKAMKAKPLEFGSKELMLNYAKQLVKRKFGYELDNILGKSVLLRQMKTQRKLKNYISQ
ncbi:hypothetical protein COV19_03325 [Candidatus Woesearchaeota archaeon CG10_big_fil_rev_8_21_14_0_10_44_13]|nr:MAG: hypothetical protein COV19_03325 [Candidatus Woesearchaeota archaeon CG10_big_fil_rev_8_21_14_0_10_44_13]